MRIWLISSFHSEQEYFVKVFFLYFYAKIIERTYRSLGGITMKKRKTLILAIASVLIIGGTIVAVKNKDLFGGIPQQKYQSTEEKQLAYLKEHEEEIKEFVKSQNPKIKSVQIDWDETKWEKVGNGTPQGGGEVVSIFGEFNNIEESDWSVMFEIENDKVIFDSMILSGPLRIGGRGFDE
mgnify:FL=1